MRRILPCPFLWPLLCGLVAVPAGAASPTPEEVRQAMRKAADFMANQVAYRGGFLWHYSEDLSQQWGEIPARPTQIWVQPPAGTPTVGEMFLTAWRVTGDEQYLRYAERAAAAVIWGQHRSGGWHYFIDFDPSGIEQYYEEVASRCLGWEEFYHYDDNCTFDDDNTTAPTRFLLHLYEATLDPKYREPLLKALNFILEAQYPNGSWPQRYPLRFNRPHDGRPDYTSFATFNDEVMFNNIDVLWEAWQRLGNEEYREAALRGMDFYLIAQMPEPQSGWAQQYGPDLKPGWARSYEPAALCSSQTVGNIRDLLEFYAMTGDRRYLDPIPRALRWLENSHVNRDPAKEYTHATFYEVGSNHPLYPAHEHTGSGPDQYITRFFVSKVYTGDRSYWGLPSIDVERLRRQYEKVAALSPQEARRELQRPERTVEAAEVRTLLDSLDSRGAWLVEIEFLHTRDWVDLPATRFRGIDTRTFINNMGKLARFLGQQKSPGDHQSADGAR